LGKNDITEGQANSTFVPPDQKVNKPLLPTFLYKNIGGCHDTDHDDTQHNDIQSNWLVWDTPGKR
jgi:hypothetical protein